MPVFDSELTSGENEQLGSSVTVRPKVRGESLKGERNRPRSLHKQSSVLRQDSSEEEIKLRRQMHKQESKDSGIVTETYTRPKEYGRSKTEGKIQRSDSGKEKLRSRKSDSLKSKSGNVTRSQSMKTPSQMRSAKHSSQSTGSLKDLDKEDDGIDILTPKQNGSVENLDQENKTSTAKIKGMWKKAFKSLKSTSEQKLTKKGSIIKKKQNSTEQEEPEATVSSEIDPVYSLLKCAADLPKTGKPMCGLHPHCSGHHSGSSLKSAGDSSGNTSKTSSPSSSASHSPKSRRKKLNARMKSFSLDTPDPPKHMLGIDETTKKKSSSFTNTCFGGQRFQFPSNTDFLNNKGSSSPDEKYTFSAANLRKKFASSAKASSLDIEDTIKKGSLSPSPKESPKSQRKQNSTVHIVLYNFKGKEKDDLDLRAGWRVTVLDSSNQDWWKGKSNGKTGYFPATYVIPLQTGQRVFQVTRAMHLTVGENGMKLHKDQIVLQVGEEEHGIIHVQAANKKQAMCPLKYLNEV